MRMRVRAHVRAYIRVPYQNEVGRLGGYVGGQKCV